MTPARQDQMKNMNQGDAADASAASGHPGTEAPKTAEVLTPRVNVNLNGRPPAPLYSITDVVLCMRVSARMLSLCDERDSKLRVYNRKQAELLFAAADDLERRFA